MTTEAIEKMVEFAEFTAPALPTPQSLDTPKEIVENKSESTKNLEEKLSVKYTANNIVIKGMPENENVIYLLTCENNSNFTFLFVQENTLEPVRYG